MTAKTWRFTRGGPDQWSLENDDVGMFVTVIYSDDRDRELLLRFLNAHDALVGALEAAVSASGQCPACWGAFEHAEGCEIDAVLKLARGEA